MLLTNLKNIFYRIYILTYKIKVYYLIIKTNNWTNILLNNLKYNKI